MTGAPPERVVRWRAAVRIIPSRYPPIQLFERLGDPEEWEEIARLESLTNDRLRDEIGEIRVVPIGERVTGPGAGWVMGSFTHLGHPTRFSDGSFGVYYASRRKVTAIRETVYHMGRFYAASSEPACTVDMRVLEGRIANPFHDLRGGSARWRRYLDPDDYGASQRLGAKLRAAGSNGIVYDSVRHEGGQCLGAFRPRAVGIPSTRSRLQYHWNGSRIDRYFDYDTQDWTTVSGNGGDYPSDRDRSAPSGDRR